MKVWEYGNMGIDVSNKINGYGKNYNIEVIIRILSVLHENGPEKITNLAMRSGINHTTCKKYSYFMQKLEWIQVTSEKCNTYLQVTNSGIKILEKLSIVAS